MQKYNLYDIYIMAKFTNIMLDTILNVNGDVIQPTREIWYKNSNPNSEYISLGTPNSEYISLGTPIVTFDGRDEITFKDESGKEHEFFIGNDDEFFDKDDLTYFNNLYYKVPTYLRRKLIEPPLFKRQRGGKRKTRKTRKTRETRK